jgi:hypothetical protein
VAKALVYRNHRGAAQLYYEPKADGVQPESATIPGGPFPRASEGVAARGNKIPWKDWADHLSEQLPYFDSWSHEDVPDGLAPNQALALVRQRDAARFLEG